MSDKTIIILISIAVIAIVIFAIIKIKALADWALVFIRDTLKRKKEGAWYWSTTKLTMASAWFTVLYSYLFDLWKNGFNETAFMVLVGVALGAKVTDAWSKKIDPLVGPPPTEKTE